MDRRGRSAGVGVGVVVGLVLALGLSACALAGRHGRQGTPERPAPITLEVDNQNFYDADVYTVIGGQRMRLGTVTGESKAHFTFPWTPQDVGMQVHLVGVGTYNSDTMQVYPGDRLVLVLMPDMHTRIGVAGRP